MIVIYTPTIKYIIKKTEKKMHKSSDAILSNKVNIIQCTDKMKCNES